MTTDINDKIVEGSEVVIPKGVRSAEGVTFEKDVKGDVYSINRKDRVVVVDTSSYYTMLIYKTSDLRVE